MFKFAEEELLNKLKKLKEEVKPTEEDLKKIQERLENITNYDDLNKDNSIKGVLTFVFFLIGSVANLLIFGLGFPIELGIASVICLGLTGLEIKFIISNNKEIKELKQKCVNKDKKDKNFLLEKEENLEKEKEAYQDRANEINKVLKHINFYYEKANNLYYQADSKEEFYKKLANFDEFLQEKTDYSKVHYDIFDSTISPITLENDNMTLRKLLK